MIPFLHLGPVTLATYGLCVGIAMLVSYFVMARDFERRGITAPADLMVAVPCIAGLIGAKLYHVLETPKELFADPRLLISQYGFAWFGGFLGGLIAFVILARYYRAPLLEIFDAASPAAALGYGLGRIGCLLSGDGDYGIPTSLPWGMSFPNGTVPTTQRVHPTPIYELIVAIFIFWWLWRSGARQVHGVAKSKGANGPAMPGSPRGAVFGQYLVLTGLARYLVEFIRINPRSFFGMTNAQTASVVSVILGVALIWHLRRKSA
ncbi:MAG TPA: prolipoprotein diacylglyceryl transferase [Candidatus Acidoferrales bacterium]|nr:prolipoprotein diacylglyceryl transferase [Candidatus Acidoferrales bacterium]